MKVLHVIHSLSGGGAERQLLSLIDSARAHDEVEMAVFCVRPGNAYLKVENIYTARGDQRLYASLFSGLKAAITNFKPDVLHAWLPPAVTIPSMLIAALMRIPVIFSYRNAMFFHRPLDAIEYALALLISRRIVSNAPIHTCAAQYKFLYRVKKGIHIPNSVDVPKKEAHVHFDRSVKEFIFVGRITKAKNWQTMIRAFAALKDRADWRLSIYGKGDQEGVLQKSVSDLDLDNRISYVGFSESIYDVMAKADALVFPSIYEGMPNVLLEALGTGLYIIASDIPGSRQVVGVTDCLSWFSPLDAEGLRICIEEYLDGFVDIDGRRRNGLAIAKAFSRECTLRRHLDVYQELTQPNARSVKRI